jgi:hypothetical protein
VDDLAARKIDRERVVFLAGGIERGVGDQQKRQRFVYQVAVVNNGIAVGKPGRTNSKQWLPISAKSVKWQNWPGMMASVSM